MNAETLAAYHAGRADERALIETEHSRALANLRRSATHWHDLRMHALNVAERAGAAAYAAERAEQGLIPYSEYRLPTTQEKKEAA